MNIQSRSKINLVAFLSKLKMKFAEYDIELITVDSGGQFAVVR